MKSLLLSVILLGTLANSTIISASTAAVAHDAEQDITAYYDERFTALNSLYAYTYDVLDAAVAQTEPTFTAEAQQVADTLKQQLQERQSLINDQRTAIIEQDADFILEQLARELVELLSQLVEQK